MTSTSQVRKTFLDFFGARNHNVLPSSALVPHNDPTLMFTNAGMVPFKNIFTGAENPPSPPRATTSQKCVRAGGKHNDLDNVGYTARHHTFFEMLGNFSFGDYFKEEAIVYAWELLTKDFGLDKDKLGATVYHTDDEAFELWKKISGLPESRILRIPTSDNFWAMGDTGPCGPCSEVFYDHGADAAEGKWELDANGNDLFGDRYIEIWNLVFMQYEQVDADTRIDLPKPCVDTGMGLERVAAVLQGVHDNYDTDLFKHLMAASESITKTKAVGEHAASHKIIADHLRSASFLIADGVLPSNEGRGYVLRRIMRRAMRHLHILGAQEALMYHLVPALITEMGEAYPELVRANALITETIRSEEIRFRETLGRGLKLLEEEQKSLSSGGKLSGDAAFKLYDTYGFPLDLTQDILRSNDLTVDTDGFDSCMAEQKARARAAWKGSGDAATSDIWFGIQDRVPATEFLGYTSDTASASILAIVKDGAEVSSISKGDKAVFIVNQTPAYGESGGQIGDTGSIIFEGKTIAELTDTTKPVNNLHAHHITLKDGSLSVDDIIDITIDTARRDAIRANHSATHLLHAALRNHLGEHVTQKGSQVSAEGLRFDFSHNQGLSPEDITAIEREVNAIIWQNNDVATKLMKPDEAIEAGAMALFGEKYGDEVRVLSMGKASDAKDYSVELCGGTHVERTGDIGLLKITTESAIASGIRRIEAITNADAFAYLSNQERIVSNLSAGFKVSADELEARVDAISQERKDMQKELAEAKKQLALGGSGGGDTKIEDIGAYKFCGQHFPDLPPKELRSVAEELVAKTGENAVIALSSGFEGRGSILVALAKNLTDSVKAADFVQIAVPILGGKGGGGRPEMAQGGGPDGAKGEDAIAAIRDALSKNAA